MGEAFRTGWAVVKSDSMRQMDRAGREGFTTPPRKTGECEICRAIPAKMTTVRDPEYGLHGAMLCGPCAEILDLWKRMGA